MLIRAQVCYWGVATMFQTQVQYPIYSASGRTRMTTVEIGEDGEIYRAIHL